MKIVFSHPTGNANVRAAAIALANANILGKFYTTIASFPGSMLDSMSKYRPLVEIKRRQYDPILQPYTEMLLPWLEAGRMVASKAGFKKLVKNESGFFNISRVYNEFDKKVAAKIKQNKFDAIYAYEDGAFNSFKEAMDLGLPRFYDLPIGYWRTSRILLADEKEKWPDWAGTLTGFSDSDENPVKVPAQSGHFS